ncbi:hypothetical protein [Bacillus cereus]|uniref:hypothetical protein n=1 Tax=Bacillus cereus TaxID=1396 RepID=UPI000BF5D4B3|nr:hypothetical protein [Bacillus cereus]PFR51027.1 hypothetical protein COK35_07605 [Bacillus cereus]
MSQETNEEMEVLIRSWGLPEAFKEQEDNIDYIFDGNISLSKHKQKFYCRNGEVKFCLYDTRNYNVLFSLEFWKICPEGRVGSLFKEKSMRLNFLYTEDSFRKKGISTFYIEKIRDYAFGEGIACIFVHPNANAEDFKDDSKMNALSQDELKKFYKKFTNDEVIFKLV